MKNLILLDLVEKLYLDHIDNFDFVKKLLTEKQKKIVSSNSPK